MPVNLDNFVLQILGFQTFLVYSIYFAQYVVGWGRNSTDKNDRGQIFITGASTNILQQLQVPIVPFVECKDKFKEQPISDELHICAGGKEGLINCLTVLLVSFCC